MYILIHIGSFSFTLLKLKLIVLSSGPGKCSVLSTTAISSSLITIIASLRELCFFLLWWTRWQEQLIHPGCQMCKARSHCTSCTVPFPPDGNPERQVLTPLPYPIWAKQDFDCLTSGRTRPLATDCTLLIAYFLGDTREVTMRMGKLWI